MTLKNKILSIHSFYFKKNDVLRPDQRHGFLWAYYNIVVRLCNLFLIVYLRFERLFFHPNMSQKVVSDVVVSLTTFPARIDKLWMVLDSILNQTVLPKKIILVLAIDEFPGRINDVPKNLLVYRNYGLEFLFVEKNLKPHNKYFYTFEKFYGDLVLTIDDDCYYKPDLIKRMLEVHDMYPNCVCSSTICKIEFDKNGKFLPYSEWKDIFTHVEPSNVYLALGVCGVLYPTSLFDKNIILNADVIRSLCLQTDDLWLKANEVECGVPVVNGEYCARPCSVLGTQKFALSHTNCENGPGNGNDVQWSSLVGFFNLKRNMFFCL
jgi:hypothetical protein